MSKNGLKIVPKKDASQKTLEEAISAGQLRQEAMKLRKQTLLEQDEILVIDYFVLIVFN